MKQMSSLSSVHDSARRIGGQSTVLNSNEKVIQVDLDPGILGANKPVDLAIQADAKTFLTQLYGRLFKRREEIAVDGRKAKNEKIIAEKDKTEKTGPAS